LDGITATLLNEGRIELRNFGKGGEDDRGLESGRQQPQYPIGTVAMYGPDDKTTTKIAAGVILHNGAEPILKRWVATDITTNPKVQQELKDFFLQHGVKSVTMSQGNMGCPHEEARIFRFVRSGRGSRGATERTDAHGILLPELRRGRREKPAVTAQGEGPFPWTLP
jgi:hypothetical protein